MKSKETTQNKGWVLLLVEREDNGRGREGRAEYVPRLSNPGGLKHRTHGEN